MQTYRDWKDGEVPWLADVVRRGSHPSIGDGNLPAYLRTQAASARRDGLAFLASELDTVAILVEHDRYGAAVRTMDALVDGAE